MLVHTFRSSGPRVEHAYFRGVNECVCVSSVQDVYMKMDGLPIRMGTSARIGQTGLHLSTLTHHGRVFLLRSRFCMRQDQKRVFGARACESFIQNVSHESREHVGHFNTVINERSVDSHDTLVMQPIRNWLFMCRVCSTHSSSVRRAGFD